MSWFCKACNTKNANLVRWCNYCRSKLARISNRPNEFEPFDFIDEVRAERIYRLLDRITGYYVSNEVNGVKTMTPQEELFAGFFNHEKVLVKDMETLELRAHREELVKIAFEARARITAIDDEEASRKKKDSSEKLPTGFARSINGDNASSELINKVKDRQKKLTKKEKLEESLKNLLGGDAAAAALLMTSGTILQHMKDKDKPIAQKAAPRTNEQVKPIFNPFEKK